MGTLTFSTSFAAEKSLDIHEYLQLAQKNDVEIKKILHERSQITFLKSLSLPSSALVFALQNEYGFAIGDGVRTTVLKVGAEKPIQTTGTTLSASYGLNKQEDREEQETKIAIEQSLFKNALGKQNRRLDKKLTKENEVILLQTVEAYEDYIAAIISNFLDWQLTHLNRKVAESQLNESKTLQKYIEDRKRRNIAADVDVGKINLESMGYKEAILELEVALSSQIAAIGSTIGVSKFQNISPSDQLSWVQANMNFDKEKEESIKNGRMIRAYLLTEEAGQLEISISKEDLHPELNLIFGFSYDDSTRFNVTTDRKEIFVGFNLELPLFDTKTGAEIKKARYEKMSASLAKDLYKKNLISSLDSQISKIKKQQERVEISEKKWKLSEDVAKKERLRYNKGKIDLETLIAARQAVAKNHFTYLSNHVQLNKDLIEWLRLTDRLVVKDKIALN